MAAEEQRFRYEGADGAPLMGFAWRDRAATPRAIVQLAHGAGEHAGRYFAPMAPILAAGYVIYAADHRGHGMTSGLAGLGEFGPGGAAAVVQDMAALSALARREVPDLPLVLMGHSMGAMLSQAYLLDHSMLIDALVLSGTTGPGRRIAGDLNAGFEGRTAYDWLSRDPAEVDKYVADPFCGINFSEASRNSFQSLRERTPTPEALAKVKAGLPVYVFVGDLDPINRKLEGLTPLIDAYRGAGLQVTLKVYEGGRHQMLNETNRNEVVADLLTWLNATVG